MRKLLSALFVVVMLLSLVSCATTGADAGLVTKPTIKPIPEGMKAPYGAEKLWNLDLGEGYTHTDSQCRVSRYDGSVELRFSISPLKYRRPLPTDAKPLVVGEKEYKTWNGSEVVNLPEGVVTRYTKIIFWERDGLAFALKAISNDFVKFSEAVVTPELAEMLMENPLAEISGFRIASYEWSTSMQNSDRSINITLSHPVTGENSEFATTRRYDSFVKDNSEGVEYYYQENYGSTRNERNMYWVTDLGLFSLSGRLLSTGKGSMDYYNVDFIKRINSQMGASPCPFPVPTASPEPTKKPNIKPDDPLVMKLWLLDISQGFECDTASRYMVWEGLNEANSKTTVTFQSEIGYRARALKPPSAAESVKKNDVEYFVLESLKVGDYRREIYWVKDGVSYKLMAETFLEVKKVSIDIASPETAEALTKNPLAGISGLKLTKDFYHSSYLMIHSNKKDITQINFYLYSPMEIESIRMMHLNRIKYERNKDGKPAYYIYNKSNEEGNLRDLLWNTDTGIFSLIIEAPADPMMSNLEFADGSFVESINRQLGAKPLPFPD